jgi:hypothetical protein
MSELSERIRMNISAGSYEKAYSIGRDALNESASNRDEIIAALCELTARLRSECIDLAVRKMDSGADYDALENLLCKANELTEQDMYGFFKAK